MALRISMLLALIAVIVLMTAVFQNSFPLWCANPNGNGNWIIQPFCKG